MARIHKHPNVQDFFVRMDWRDARGDERGFGDELAVHYEAGRLILLANAPLTINFDLLNRLSIPEGRRNQKLSDKKLVWPKLYRREEGKFIVDTFGHRPLFYWHLRSEVRRVSSEIRTLLHSIFHRYRILKEGVSWRFTRTGPESLHVDFFRPKGDFDYLRLFVNIDEEVRVWTVSHQLEELIRRNYDSAGLAEMANAPSCDVCQRITDRVLIPLTHLPPEQTDRHVIEFEQGDVWLCETRINSHQIYSGRRMIATDCYIDGSTAIDPAMRVDARVRRTFAALAGKARPSALAV